MEARIERDGDQLIVMRGDSEIVCYCGDAELEEVQELAVEIRDALNATSAPAPTAPAQSAPDGRCHSCGGTGWQDMAVATGVKGTRQQCQRCGGSGRVTQPKADELEALLDAARQAEIDLHLSTSMSDEYRERLARRLRNALAPFTARGGSGL